MKGRIRRLAMIVLTMGLLCAVTLVQGAVAAGAATTETTPTRYAREVCLALNAWSDKATSDISGSLKDLQSGKRSPKNARQQVVHIYTAARTATDQLIAVTKKIGAPRMANGQQTATDYLQTLGDVSAAYSTASQNAARATTSDKATLTTALTTIDDTLNARLTAIDDPLKTLNESPTLTTAVQSDAGCATVLESYKSATTSGLSVGDCVTGSEQTVACGQSHDGEVTLVTSYPADSAAPYPGNDAMNAFVDQTCGTAFAQYVGVPVDQSKYNYSWYSPDPGSDWNSGDREVVCLASNADNSPLTGTVKGADS